MSYSFPVMGRCRVTVTFSVDKLLLGRSFEATLSSTGRDARNTARVGETTRAVDRARAVQGVTDGMPCPERGAEYRLGDHSE